MKGSRRIMLKSAASVAGLTMAPWAVRPAAAQQKATTQAGPISPAGWCVAFVKKS